MLNVNVYCMHAIHFHFPTLSSNTEKSYSNQSCSMKAFVWNLTAAEIWGLSSVRKSFLCKCTKSGPVLLADTFFIYSCPYRMHKLINVSWFAYWTTHILNTGASIYFWSVALIQNHTITLQTFCTFMISLFKTGHSLLVSPHCPDNPKLTTPLLLTPGWQKGSVCRQLFAEPSGSGDCMNS